MHQILITALVVILLVGCAIGAYQRQFGARDEIRKLRRDRDRR